MLNRLFIVLGLLAILALAGAYFVPRVIQWGQYRDRIEAAASEALGTKVEVIGDIHFSLLPDPELRLSDVVVGPSEDPVLMVRSVEAELSLTDFLRDRYVVRHLVLEKPRLDLKLDSSGHLTSGVTLASGVGGTGISIEDARIEGGAIHILDQRADRTASITDIDGELSLSALRGPFGFQGAADVGGARYSARIATSELDRNGAAQLTVTARPISGDATLQLAGNIATGAAPRFSGEMSYRRSPGAEAIKAGVGDLVLAGKLDAAPDGMALTDLTLQPDENQAATRLTGSAKVTLGASPRFAAEIASRVIAQPPRDATRTEAAEPYEWVRLLADLPMPPVPPIAGSLTLDVAELDLRALSMRDLHATLTTDASAWTVADATATVAGDTDASLSGRLTTAEGKPHFEGEVRLDSARLDTLAALWRPAAEGNPLYGVPASLAAHVSLENATLALSDGHFLLDGQTQKFSAVIGLEGTRSLDVTAGFTDLGREDSAILAALMPELGPSSTLAMNFPQGTVALSAQGATLFGLSGHKLSARAEWGATGIHFTALRAADYGGMKFDGTLSLAGEFTAPRVSGQMTVSLTDPSAPILQRLDALAQVPEPLANVLARSIPASLHLRLNEPNPDGAQTINIDGQAGAAAIRLTADLGSGLANPLAGTLSVKLDADAGDPTALTRQLGLGDTSLTPEGAPVHVAASLDGTVGDGFETSLELGGGGDSVRYQGSVSLADPAAPSGEGQLQVSLSDPTTLVRLLAGDGLYVPAIKGDARLAFTGAGDIRLGGLEATSAGTDVSGDLALTRRGDLATVSGSLELGGLDVRALTAQLAGPTALIAAPGQVWPAGPFSIGETQRRTVGDIRVSAASIETGGSASLTDAGFDVVWDQKALRLRDFAAHLGDGTVTGEAGVCCAGGGGIKTVTARASLDGIPMDAVLPAGVANTVSGTASGGFRVQGSGGSLGEAIGRLGGSGTLTATDLTVARLDPGAFETVAGVNDIVDLKPEDLTDIVAVALDKGPFQAPRVTTSFSVVNGVLRLSNVAADAPGGRMFGSLDLNLADLGLSGSFALSPVGVSDPKGLIGAETAKVTALISGTLLAPSRKLDLAALVDAIKMRAYEMEVARLEKLKAEDDARRKAAEEDEARRQAAQDAADAAAKKAADDAAARKAAQGTTGNQSSAAPLATPDIMDVPRPASPPPGDLRPMDLGIPQVGYD